MLLIREVVHCKPGKVRQMVENFRRIDNVTRQLGFAPMRILTDVSGERYWTVISEVEVKTLEEFFDLMQQSMASKEIQESMKGYHDLVDHGRREIFRIE